MMKPPIGRPTSPPAPQRVSSAAPGSPGRVAASTSSADTTSGVQQARGLTVLRRRDCLRLLERGGVGRLAVPGPAAPAIRPVNFAVHDGRIVMRTSDNVLCAAAGAVVDAAFEFDEVRNEDHWTWNVIVTGTLHHVGETEAALAPVRLWAPSPHEHTLALSITEISGRQVPDPRKDLPAQAVQPSCPLDPLDTVARPPGRGSWRLRTRWPRPHLIFGVRPFAGIRIQTPVPGIPRRISFWRSAS